MSYRFQAGDRLKIVDGEEGRGAYLAGEVITAARVERRDDPANDLIYFPSKLGYTERFWRAHRFELHAKAGEFVPGDRVVYFQGGEGEFKHGDVLTVEERPGTHNIRNSTWCKALDGGGPWWSSTEHFRLATAAEIEATDAPKGFKVATR